MDLDVERVLLVDDSSSYFATLRQLLLEIGSIEPLVEVETDFERALKSLSSNQYQVYFISATLGGTRMPDFVAQARSLGCYQPIILLTNQGHIELDVEGLRSGANDYLVKEHLTSGSVERALRHTLEKTRSDIQIRERLYFDKLITSMAMRFINLPAEQIEDQIFGSLRMLGETSGVDRSFVCLIDAERERASLYLEWHSEEVEPIKEVYQNVPVAPFQWVFEKLTQGQYVHIPSLDSIPPQAAEFRSRMEERGVKSLLFVPLISRNRFDGALVFTCNQRQREWSADSIRLAKIAGEILANAMQQRRVQIALQESEGRYRSVVEGLGEGILYCDRDDTILQVNSRMATLSGYPPEEMVGAKAYDLLLAPGEEYLLKERTLRRLQGVAERYEIQLKRKDGSRFWAVINATPIRDNQGNFIATLGAVTDISDQKRFLEALRESEKKYRDLVETSSDLIWSTNEQGVITFINSACIKVYGFAPEEMIGKHFTQFVAPYLRDKDLDLFKGVLGGNTLSQLETRHIGKDGRIITLEINAIPLRTSGGAIVGTTGTASDVTQRKEAEEEVRYQKDFLRQVIDASPTFIFAKDSQLRFTLVNTAFAASYGLEPEDILGKTDFDIHPNAQEAEAYQQECLQVLQTGVPVVLDERLTTDPLTGRVVWYHSIRKPFIAPDGRGVQVLTVATNVTERKRAQEDAMQLQRQLLQSQKLEAIGQLAAGVAHDLNNALGAVVGHLQLIQVSEEISTSTRSSVAIALSGCERALSLIEQLLGFSRQGKYNLSVTPIRKLVEETVSFLSRVIDKKISLEFKGDGHDLMVKVDQGQLQQALTNLIINAKQAMAGSGIITFVFGTEYVSSPQNYNSKALPGDYVVLTVADTGSGISEENLHRVFEPFFTTKGEQRGSGLGLAMVYGIAQNHGGWVDVHSKVGEGTAFSLYFPRVIGEDVNTDSREGAKITPTSGTVLVIDDEAVLVDLTRRFLELAGIGSVGFTSGSDAIEWYKENFASIDLVVLDMKMSKMDGPACFQEIQKINPGTRVAILSGYVQDAAAQDLLSRGAMKFFQKPLKYPELVQWVSETLREVKNPK